MAYGIAELQADLALDAAERAYREAMQQPYRQIPPGKLELAP
jgi:hypothetical protein